LEEGRIKTSDEGIQKSENKGAGQQHKSTKALRDQVSSIGGDDVKQVAILSFRALQLYRLGVLQKELAKIQHDLFRDGKEPEKVDIDCTIQRYADAVRNYETLTQNIVSKTMSSDTQVYEFLGENSDDFKVVDRTAKEPEIWSQLWPNPPGKTVEESPRLQGIGALGFRELDRRRWIEREREAAHSLRVQNAVFGGVALIVPMLIMALRPGLVSALVTTSVATVLFGAATVVILTNSGGHEVLASTAAYAAVLVIFVGSSLTPGGCCNT